MILAPAAPSGGAGPPPARRKRRTERPRAADLPPALLAEEAARCRALWRAVILQVLWDARGAERAAPSARAFLRGEHEDFEWVVGAAGLDPEKVRAAASRMGRRRGPLEAETLARLRALVAERPGIALREAVAVLEAEGALGGRRRSTVMSCIRELRAGVRVTRARPPSGLRRLCLWPEEAEAGVEVPREKPAETEGS